MKNRYKNSNNRRSGYDVRTKPHKKQNKFLKVFKIFILICLLLGILFAGIVGILKYREAEKDKKLIEIRNQKIEFILNILESNSKTSNAINIPTDEESEESQIIDLSINQETIDLELTEKSKYKTLMEVTNCIVDESLSITGKLINYNDSLYFTGTITNVAKGFNFPKLELLLLEYNTDLNKVSSIQHSDYFIGNESYIFSIKENETINFTVKIRDINTKNIKLGIKTGNVLKHSEANAETVRNDVTIPVITTENYTVNLTYLPYRYALVNEDGVVSKIYEHNKLIKEYKNQ